PPRATGGGFRQGTGSSSVDRLQRQTRASADFHFTPYPGPAGGEKDQLPNPTPPYPSGRCGAAKGSRARNTAAPGQRPIPEPRPCGPRRLGAGGKAADGTSRRRGPQLAGVSAFVAGPRGVVEPRAPADAGRVHAPGRGQPPPGPLGSRRGPLGGSPAPAARHARTAPPPAGAAHPGRPAGSGPGGDGPGRA